MTQTPSQKIAECVKAVEQLAKQKLPREEFYKQFLDLVVAASQAPAAAIWGIAKGQLELQSEVNLQSTGCLADKPTADKNMKLLSEIVQNSQSVVVGIHSAKAEDRPTKHLLVFSPIFEHKNCVAVLQLFFPEQVSQEAQQGLLQFAEHLAGLASLHVSGRMTSPIAINSKEFWETIDRFLLDLHNGLDTEHVAACAANDGREILSVDRASIVLKWGNKTRLMAVSGQDKVNRKSNLMRKLNTLVQTVYSTGKPFIYEGNLTELAPQVESQLADYLEESNTRMIAIYPLVYKDREHIAEDKPHEKPKPDQLIGALIVELLSSKEFDPDRRSACELISDHIATALSNSEEHEQIFLLPVWRTLGKMVRALRGKVLAKTLAALAVVLAITLSMIFVKYDYRANGDGRLMPVIQRDVFAMQDAEVQKVLVIGGQQVTAGQLLVQLKNPEMQTEFLRTQSEIDEKSLLILAQQAELDLVSRQNRIEEAVRLQGRIAETKIEISSLQEQSQILAERIEQLKVYSPIDGVVATFQVEQLLINRPIRRGEVLMEVMDPEGDWQLELDVKDKRLGLILEQQKRINSKNLDVEFVLATDPETTYDAKISSISSRTTINQESGNVVRVLADFDEQQLTELRIGSEVKGKINCGKKRLGYVLFGDAIDFIRIRFWL
ncbi:MAG: efflux RND transporter periplasmic adaptor subunit [Planctomycetaceae bacterium]|nr:efflux RND transporter periplasmic adaptor subunit [Planctomycetaceae bacterium]